MNRNGTVVTFYSYKGGVGRTLAVANIGALLATWGYRVLCVDWDLEAPGLHLYFDTWRDKNQSGGLVEMFHEQSGRTDLIWRSHLNTVRFSSGEPLHLLPAGRFDTDYVARVQALDWDKMFVDRGLGDGLEALRREWKAAYDFVLVDSRTGITDSGGICTIHLPDVLALFFTASTQSLNGVVDVAKRAQTRRNELPFDRGQLLCLPVVSRLDTRVELALAQSWLDRIAEAFEPLYRDWRHRDVKATDILKFTRVPYVAHWSYCERLPVVEEGTRDPESIGYAFETLAAIVVQRLANSDLLVSNRDSFVQAARQLLAVASDQPAFSFDVFVSHTEPDQGFAKALADRLRNHGLRVWVDANQIKQGAGWETEIQNALSSSQHLVLIAGAEPSRVQHFESKVFLDATYAQSSELAGGTGPSAQPRQIVPIFRPGANPKALPTVLQSVQGIEVGPNESLQLIADRIISSLAPTPKYSV